eukprot:5186075-Alexandrium_andersonii.AAC.1
MQFSTELYCLDPRWARVGHLRPPYSTKRHVDREVADARHALVLLVPCHQVALQCQHTLLQTNLLRGPGHVVVHIAGHQHRERSPGKVLRDAQVDCVQYVKHYIVERQNAEPRESMQALRISDLHSDCPRTAGSEFGEALDIHI